MRPLRIWPKKANFKLSDRQIPYRDEYKWFLQPWLTCYHGAEQFAGDVFNFVEPNAIVYADNTTVYPLLYEQEVKGRRPDIMIISGLASSKGSPVFNADTIDGLLPNVPIYVVSAVKGYLPKWLFENYAFEKAGPIWKVLRKRMSMGFFENKRIVVTGGAGFLGSYVTQKLESEAAKIFAYR